MGTGIVVILTTGGAVLAKDIMAALIERPVSVAELSAASVLSSEPHPFPSGHVAGTAALLGFVAISIGAHGGTALRFVLASCVLVATSIVAVSRIVLHAHWLSDVVGGTLLAAIAVTIGGTLLAAASRSRRRRVPAYRVVARRGSLRA